MTRQKLDASLVPSRVRDPKCVHLYMISDVVTYCEKHTLLDCVESL